MSKPTYEELEKRVKELEKAETEHERTETILQNRPDILDLFFKHTLDCVVLLDKDFNFIRVNEAYAKVCQREVSEFPGHNHFEFYPSDAQAIFEDVVKTKEPFKITARPFEFPDHPEWGVTYWDWVLVPILNDKEEAFLLIFTLKDVTKRINAENELKKHQEHLDELVQKRTAELHIEITDRKKTEEELRQYEHIISATSDHMSFLDQNYIYQAVNEAYLNAHQKTREEIIGHSVADILKANVFKQLVKEKLDRCLAGEEIQYQSWFDFPGLGQRYMDVVYYPYIEADQSISGIIVSSHDITDCKKAEEALRKSETLLTETGRMAKVGGWEVDVKTLEISWTEETYRLHEVPLSHKPSLEEAINFFHPDDRQKLETAIQKALEHGEPYDMEIRFITAKGKHLWTHTNCKPITVNGKTVKLTGTFQDITERKKAEEALKKSEENAQKYLDIAGTILVALNNKGEVALINRKGCEVLGYAKEDIIGKNWFDNYIQKKTLEAGIMDVFNQLIKGEVKLVEFYENPILTKGGEERLIAWHNTIIHDDTGKIVGLLSSGEDITERKKAEEALRESEKRFHNLADLLPQIVCETDNHGKLIYVNKNAYDVFGYSEDDFNEGINAMQTLIPEDRERAKQNIMNVLSGKKVGYSEYTALKKDGSTFPIILYSSPIIKENNVVGLRGIIVDITERKRLEEQLQIRQRMDSLGTLASGIAHDFNNLLVGIIGNIDMLNMDSEGLTELQKEYLNNAMKSSERAALLIGQFQTLSRGTVAGNVSVDVYEAADEVFGVLEETTDRLMKKKIDLGQGKFYITASPTELNQVFMNLGMNAVYAIEEKGVKRGDYISIKAEDCSITGTDITGLSEGEYVHIIFEDSGTGMTDEVRRKAFDPLFTTKEMGTQKGQGLGLAIVYNIVTRNHGGHITIESSVGKGTTFHIYLPKTHSEAQAIPEEIMGVAGGDETVLIIEDEDIILKLVRNILEKSGYTVLTAEDGEKGLDIHKKKKDSIDLVILDLTMPEMSGQMVFEKMLKIDPKVKVIISSGHSEEETRKGILSLAKGYLEKPYKIRELAQAVRAVLDTWD